MNPTEYFIAELAKLLEKHSAETGTYIEIIKIERFLKRDANTYRAERPMTEIELELK